MERRFSYFFDLLKLPDKYSVSLLESPQPLNLPVISSWLAEAEMVIVPLLIEVKSDFY
jgi:hypothetical protein